MSKQPKAFYSVGLHHCKITDQRYYMHKKDGETCAVFEVGFEVLQKVNPATNKIEEHSQKYNRPFKVWIKKSNFDICIEQINALLKHCGVTEPLSDFAKLDPDNPDCYKLVDKVVPMWCSHQDNGWENWIPSSDRKQSKTKEKPKNDPSASEFLNSMYGARLQNKAEQVLQEQGEQTQQETSPPPVTSPPDDDTPF